MKLTVITNEVIPLNRLIETVRELRDAGVEERREKLHRLVKEKTERDTLERRRKKEKAF
jgi:hypothetical protein